MEEIQRACRLDPLSPILSTLHAEFLYHARRNQESISQSLKALDLEPDFWISHLNLARAYEQIGDYGRAIIELEKAGASSSGNSEPIGLLGYVLARSGKQSASEEKLEELIQLAKSRYVPPFNLALNYWGLGDKDTMFEFLEKGCEERDVHMTFLLDPKWDPLRSESRFILILEAVGLSAQAGEKAQREFARLLLLDRRFQFSRIGYPRARVVHVFDLFLHALAELIHVAWRVVSGRNRFPNHEFQLTRPDVKRIHRQDFVGPDNRHGGHRHTRFDRDIERSLRNGRIWPVWERPPSGRP